jgi:anti-sigma-K factor RskA
MMEHQEIKDLLPLAALDRLEGEEARALSDHLETGCAECEAELREYREVAASLALALEPAGSHVRIVERLNERLATSGDSSRLRAMHRRQVLAPAARSQLIGWRVATGIATAALIAASTFATLSINRAARLQAQLERQMAVRDAELRELRSRLAASRHEIVTLEHVLRDKARLDQILMAPDLRLTRLEPLKPAPRSAGLVVVSRANRAALLQVSGLPPTPDDKTYELWWITRESGPIKAGLFQVRRSGTVIAEAEPPPAGEHALLSAVTLEPAGGSNSPTGAMYLKGVAG